MKNKKYTKKQLEAVDSLVTMIDELDNKPRRLYSSLREVASAFIENKDHRDEVRDSLDEAEELYYRNRRVPEYASDIFRSRDKVLRTMRSRENKRDIPDERSAMYDIKEALDMMTKEVVGNLVDF